MAELLRNVAAITVNLGELASGNQPKDRAIPRSTFFRG